MRIQRSIAPGRDRRALMGDAIRVRLHRAGSIDGEIVRSTPSLLISFLVVVVAACDAWILGTRLELPARVITKWINGVPTNFMAREEWITAACVMTTLAGFGLAALGILTARRFPRFLHRSIPGLPEPIRNRVVERAQWASVAIGSWGAIWMTWFHALVVEANRSTPPELRSGPVLGWVAAHLIAVLVLVVAMHRIVGRARQEAGATAP